MFDASTWSKDVLKHHRKNRDLVCPSCAERGFAPGKCEEHVCAECLEKFGSLMFGKDILINAKRQDKSRKVCVDCQTKLRCGACKTAYELTYWSKNERGHHNQQGTPLVCKACRSLGHHPADMASYTCQTCKCELGAKKFDQILLKHYKHHDRQKLECKQCAADCKERVRDLQRKLRTSKRVCKCHSLFHSQTCPLFPAIYGEKRWPGSDGAISHRDRQFLDALNPRPSWWSKAWGRTP